jgi:hypothetical protein
MKKSKRPITRCFCGDITMKKILLFMTLASVFVGMIGCGCGGGPFRNGFGLRRAARNGCCAPTSSCSDCGTSDTYYSSPVVQGGNIAPIEIAPGPVR